LERRRRGWIWRIHWCFAQFTR